MTEALPAYVACPRCHGPLTLDGELIRCPACDAAYERRAGVPIFLAGSTRDVAAVQVLYDEVAGEYDEVFVPHVLQHYLDKRLALIREILPGGRLLDVGCGTGALAAHVAAEGYEVVGVDASVGMLAKAAERTAVTPSIDSRAGDLRARGLAGVYAALSTALPFRDDSFDLAYTVATLHHLETSERVAGTVAEMARVVRAGGSVLLWDHNPANPYWPIIMRRVPQDSGSERLVPLAEMLADVRAAGLRPVAVRRLSFVPEFVPAHLMPLARAVERRVESTKGLRVLAAHNVVIARKV